MTSSKLSSFWKTKYDRVLTIMLFILALFLKLWRLGSFPFGIDADEASVMTNAWSIIHNGTDRYLNAYPIYFQNIYGGQSALHTYLTALLFKIFNNGEMSLFLTRLIVSVFSIIAYVFGVILIRKLFDRSLALIGQLIFTVAPIFIQLSRCGIDCMLYGSLIIIALSLLYMAFESDKISLFITTGLIMGISYYSYCLSYIVNTFFIICVAFILMRMNKRNIYKVVALIAPMIVLGIPLLYFVLVDTFGFPEYRGIISIVPMSVGRAQEFFSKDIGLNFLDYFSTLFLGKKQALFYFEKCVPFYTLSIPFSIIGLFALSLRLVKDRGSNVLKDVFFRVIASLIVVAFIFSLTHRTTLFRANELFFPQLLIILIGIEYTISKFQADRKKFLVAIISIYYILSFMVYAWNYYFFSSRNYIDIGTESSLLDDVFEEIDNRGLEDRIIMIDAPDTILLYALGEIDLKAYNEANRDLNYYQMDYLNWRFFNLQDNPTVWVLKNSQEEYIQYANSNNFEEFYSNDFYTCYLVPES